MELGNLLKQREQQYAAERDERGTWRILDSWSDQLANVGPEDDIPDTHPAITVLSESAFHAVLKEAQRLQLLDKIVGNDDPINPQVILDFQKEIDRLKEENDKLKSDLTLSKKEVVRTSDSESFRLKKEAMSSILKIVAVQAIES